MYTKHIDLRVKIIKKTKSNWIEYARREHIPNELIDALEATEIPFAGQSKTSYNKHNNIQQNAKRIWRHIFCYFFLFSFVCSFPVPFWGPPWKGWKNGLFLFRRVDSFLWALWCSVYCIYVMLLCYIRVRISNVHCIYSNRFNHSILLFSLRCNVEKANTRMFTLCKNEMEMRTKMMIKYFWKNIIKSLRCKWLKRIKQKNKIMKKLIFRILRCIWSMPMRKWLKFNFNHKSNKIELTYNQIVWTMTSSRLRV